MKPQINADKDVIKNSDAKPQKTLNSLKILYISVLSVVKNSCSVILNLFQNLVSRKARKKGAKACPERSRRGAKKNFKTTFLSQNSPPFKGGRGDVADYKSSPLNEGGRLSVREATPPFIPPQGGTKLGMRNAEVRSEKGNVISGKYQHAAHSESRKNIAGKNLFIKLKAFCYALSVLSVVKNSCSVILNPARILRERIYSFVFFKLETFNLKLKSKIYNLQLSILNLNYLRRLEVSNLESGGLTPLQRPEKLNNRGLTRNLAVLKILFIVLFVISAAGCTSLLKYVRPRPVSLIATEQGMLFKYYNPNASTVTIAGDWNDWGGASSGRYDPHIDAMTSPKNDGVWQIYVKLQPGKHSYKFVIDSNTWITDPANVRYDSNGNSEITVSEQEATQWAK